MPQVNKLGKSKAFDIISIGSKTAIRAPCGVIMPIQREKAYYLEEEFEELLIDISNSSKISRGWNFKTTPPAQTLPANAPMKQKFAQFSNNIYPCWKYLNYEILACKDELQELMILKLREPFLPKSL